MDYIKRLITHYSGSGQQPLRAQPDLQQYPHQPHTSPVQAQVRPATPPLSPPQLRSRLQWDQSLPRPQRARRYSAPLPSPQQPLPDQSHSHRHHRHRSHHHRSGEPRSRRRHTSDPVKMPSEGFSGPACNDLVEFMKSVKGIPSKHKGAFDDMSKKAIETSCDIDALHVWESGDDVDDLLQLTQVIMKLKIEVAKQEGKRRKEPAMVIISSEQPAKNGHDAFERICEIVHYLTEIDGKKHLNGTVCAFNAIVIVRGINYTSNSDEKTAIQRINIAIERVFKMQRPSTKQLVWHQGPILSLLLNWIDNTTSELRLSITAISITAALDLADGVKPSPLGKVNKLDDLKLLEDYAKKLGVPVVFVDPASQLVTYEYLATYMYYWAYYIHTFLPPSVLRPHFYQALDDMITFAFRLRGASDGEYSTDVVRLVQEHLTASTARRWASTCINPSSYTKELCRGAGTDAAIHHAVQLADCPFTPFAHIPGYPLPAFSRLPLCPADEPSKSTGALYFAAPVKFNFTTCAFRATSAPPFYILLPREGQDVEKLTGHIQGMMMGVLQRVRQDKGEDMRGIDRVEGELWSEVVNACLWAIEGCKGKMPEGVEGKVKYVREKLKEGTFSHAVGVAKKKTTKEDQWQGGQVQQALNAQSGPDWQGWQTGGYQMGRGQGVGGQGGQGGNNWPSSQQNQNDGGWSSGAATVGNPW